VAQAKPLKSLPAQFNAEDLEEQQFLATSADGTKVFMYCVQVKRTNCVALKNCFGIITIAS
jgi:prolyl oligopeptidase PreP (S9A serine peptidase family)